MPFSKLTYKLSDTESLLFYGDDINHRHDFFIKANCALKDVKTLFFFDSRGISKDYEHSLIKRIVDELGDSINYLIIGRPLEITIWMTLYNFVEMNNLNLIKIFTNMGFVDFTPKKQSIIQQSIDQYTPYFGSEKTKIDFIEQYASSTGEILDLYMQDYPPAFLTALHKLLGGVEVIILNTPELRHGYQFERERPASFFQGVNKSNAFNLGMNSFAKVLTFTGYSELETYDGVHYTDAGNNDIFQCLKPFLNSL